jgi:hypothetical protein
MILFEKSINEEVIQWNRNKSMMTYAFDACSNIFGKSMRRRRRRWVSGRWQQRLSPRRYLHCSTPSRQKSLFLYSCAVKSQFFTSRKQLNFTHLTDLHLSLKVFRLVFGERKEDVKEGAKEKTASQSKFTHILTFTWLRQKQSVYRILKMARWNHHRVLRLH